MQHNFQEECTPQLHYCRNLQTHKWITITHLIKCKCLEPVDMICKLWVLLAELWNEERLLILGDATHHIGINYTL